MISNETRKNKTRGKPSLVEQLKIRTTLEECFYKGISPSAAERITGHNINTIKKYYHEFYEKIKDSLDKEFLQACKTRRAYTSAALENDLLKMTSQREKLESVLDDGKLNIALHKLMISLNEKIVDLRIKILDIENFPTYDEKVKAVDAEGEQK